MIMDMINPISTRRSPGRASDGIPGGVVHARRYFAPRRTPTSETHATSA